MKNGFYNLDFTKKVWIEEVLNGIDDEKYVNRNNTFLEIDFRKGRKKTDHLVQSAHQ